MIINNHLACIIIWYNPNKNAVNNILKYYKKFSQIIIVDNSLYSNVQLAIQIPNVDYIPNCANLGIAKALNIGCKKALDLNYDWCMTMDQDSSWESFDLDIFLKLCNSQDNRLIASYAPSHTNIIKSNIGYFYNSIKKVPTEEVIFRNKVMTSGNLINLKTWESIGKFNEKLFIDEVDHEFCYRLIQNGFLICEFQDVYMIHTLGQSRKTILPRPCKHSGVRLFYIFRNMLYIKQNFPHFFKLEHYRKYMVFSYIQKLLELKFSDIKFIHKGIKAFKKQQYGPYTLN